MSDFDSDDSCNAWNYGSFLFGNVDEDGNLEGNILDEVFGLDLLMLRCVSSLKFLMTL